MTQLTLPPLTAFVQASTNRSFVLRRSAASIWRDQWPTERIGDILVSESPGSINGSVFIYWTGGKSIYSADVRRWIQEHLEDHDVARICYVPELPADVHSSLKGDLAELKAKAAARDLDPKSEAIAWADAYLNDAGLTTYTDLVNAHRQQPIANAPASDQREAALANTAGEATESFAWAAFAENGNVIIWSTRRNEVEPIAAKYSRPVVPVIALDIRVASARRVDVKEHQHRFMGLLAQAEAICVDGHAMVREWQTAVWTGEPDNEVVHFNYRHHDVDHYVILTEESISEGHIDSRLRFHGVDHEGTSLSIQFFHLAPLAGYVEATSSTR
jgi:hypothetical protein